MLSSLPVLQNRQRAHSYSAVAFTTHSLRLQGIATHFASHVQFRPLPMIGASHRHALHSNRSIASSFVRSAPATEHPAGAKIPSDAINRVVASTVNRSEGQHSLPFVSITILLYEKPAAMSTPPRPVLTKTFANSPQMSSSAAAYYANCTHAPSIGCSPPSRAFRRCRSAGARFRALRAFLCNPVPTAKAASAHKAAPLQPLLKF